MKRKTSIFVGAISLTAACSSSVLLPVRYAVLVDDWHGDFLRNPVTGFDSPLPVSLVGQLSRDIRPNRGATDTLRVFRLSDGAEVAGGMREGNLTIDGRVLPPPEAAIDRAFVADAPLEDGWYLAAFDARSYRPRRLEVLYWGQAIDDVAYARFRIGDGVDWIRTRTSTVSETGEITLSVQLSSPVPLPDLDETRVEVRRGAEDISCTLFPLDVLTTRSLELLCPTLAVGDRIEVRVQSDFVGHPSGEMVPHAFMVGAQASYDVAPELGLDVLRAAYAIEGGGT